MRLALHCTILLDLILTLAAASGAATNHLGDDTIRTYIVGSWVVDSTSQSGTRVTGRLSFTKDGKFTTAVKIAGNTGSADVSYDGTWDVKDGYLVETVKRSSDTKVAPLERVTRDFVITIDADALKYRTEKGKIVDRRRVK